MSKTDFNTQLMDFTHVTESGRVKATLANLRYLFDSYGISCQYDEILKKQSVVFANYDIDDNDMSESSAYAQIKSLFALNNLPLSSIDLLPALMEQNRFNPVLEFIKSKPWDKNDRVKSLCAQLEVNKEDEYYRDMAVKTWLVQCVAAADSAKHSPIENATAKFELVLVLQGQQGLGKTTWFKTLVPESLSKYVIDGAHLDTADKDSIKKCTSTWICELGELDATFRKSDIARLKAFLSSEVDSIRLPYDRVPSSFKRKTSFGASVNATEFLVDSTGSRRFLPIAVTNIVKNTLNMQQVWAQVWELYLNGTQWWCTPNLDQMLEKHHAIHAEISPIIELITEYFNVNEPVKRFDVNLRFEHKSVTAILQDCGVKMATKDQIKQAKTFLEKNGFVAVQNSKGIKGYWIANASIAREFELSEVDNDYSFLDD